MSRRGDLVTLAGCGLLLVALAVIGGLPEVVPAIVGVCAYLAWCTWRRG